MRKTSIVFLIFVALCFLLTQASYAYASVNYNDFKTEADTISFDEMIHADYGIWTGNDQQSWVLPHAE
jgi:hypothetical protein